MYDINTHKHLETLNGKSRCNFYSGSSMSEKSTFTARNTSACSLGINLGHHKNRFVSRRPADLCNVNTALLKAVCWQRIQRKRILNSLLSFCPFFFFKLSDLHSKRNNLKARKQIGLKTWMLLGNIAYSVLCVWATHWQSPVHWRYFVSRFSFFFFFCWVKSTIF